MLLKASCHEQKNLSPKKLQLFTEEKAKQSKKILEETPMQKPQIETAWLERKMGNVFETHLWLGHLHGGFTHNWEKVRFRLKPAIL